MNNTDGFLILLTCFAVTASAISGRREAGKHEKDLIGATTVVIKRKS